MTGFRQTWTRDVAKRAVDIVAVATLLPTALPLMAVIACLILFDDGPPITYLQARVGRHGKIFALLKFRSMAKDAEKDGQAYWASVNDRRMTRIGHFMRRTRIDELPQLLNILNGEMSCVGPRPEHPQIVAKLMEQIPLYAVRHRVKPGLVSWAQVCNTDGVKLEGTVKELEYDLYYVKNHTLLLDLLILLKQCKR